MQHPVDDEIHCHGQQRDGAGGHQRQRGRQRPDHRERRIGDELGQVTDHGAPVGQRRLDADAKEGQRGDGQEHETETKAEFGQQRRERVRRRLNDLGLAGLERRPIHALSGGQKQRLAIAGALASEATLLLLDEPTALLDPDSQTSVLAAVQELCRRPDAPLTALWITHRLEELAYADGAAQMSEGRIGPWMSGTELQRLLQHGSSAR